MGKRETRRVQKKIGTIFLEKVQNRKGKRKKEREKERKKRYFGDLRMKTPGERRRGKITDES